MLLCNNLENLVNDYLLECLLFIRIFHYCLQQNENEYNRLPLIFTGHRHSYYHSVLTVLSQYE